MYDGYLPMEWGNLTMLTIMDLSRNKIQGSIPGNWSGKDSPAHCQYQKSHSVALELLQALGPYGLRMQHCMMCGDSGLASAPVMLLFVGVQ
jgi:hypothetical protein